MAISIEDIKKLRAMTGAGLADVKKALTEAEGDFDKAKEILRERGLAIAAKRSDRETSNGCVLVKKADNFAAMIAYRSSSSGGCLVSTSRCYWLPGGLLYRCPEA